MLTTLFYGCYYSYIMSSITRQNYSAFQQSRQNLWIRLEQQFNTCRQKSQIGTTIEQILWQQFEEDLKQLFLAIDDLTEVVVEEWSTIDKLETFIKNLEIDNTELFEQNQHNLHKYEENEQQRLQQTQIINQLKQMLYLQHQKTQVQVNQQQQELLKQYKINQIELGLQLSRLRKEIQSLSLQKDEILQELSLKNTEIELAQLVIQDLRKDNYKMQHIYSTVYQQRQDNKSFDSCYSRSNSYKKTYDRHNSLLQDLAQSQLVYQPRINSQMFKSTQTIVQAIEENNYDAKNIEAKSSIKSQRKNSKAVSVHMMHIVKDSYTQTENNVPLFSKYFRIMKDKIVSKRIKKWPK